LVTSADVIFSPEKLMTWSKFDCASRIEPSPERASSRSASSLMSIFSAFAISFSRSKIFCSGIVRNSNSWHRDSIVSGTLCSSVVAITKTTFDGGSSSVFRSALNAALES